MRRFCLKNEWARNAAVLFGAALFLGTIWISIDYQLEILHWIRQNMLLNLALLGLVSAVNLTLIFGSLFLGFTECHVEDQYRDHVYHGRRSGNPFLPGITRWMDHMGNKRPRK
ncbi:MAG: hypothetical protein H6907_05845 [Hyphomicrobiales bacterium]|nr:hypothetical protein [Hyphomicrobiales bacterium]